MTLTDRQQLAYIAGQAADARLNLELETEGMVLNIGPQHPATHGTLRVIVRLDGEQVVAAEPAERKLERAIRDGAVRRYHGIDWIGDAATKGVLTAEEAAALREVEELTARVIAVDHFDPAEVKPNYVSVGHNSRSGQGLAAE